MSSDNINDNDEAGTEGSASEPSGEVQPSVAGRVVPYVGRKTPYKVAGALALALVGLAGIGGGFAIAQGGDDTAQTASPSTSSTPSTSTGAGDGTGTQPSTSAGPTTSVKPGGDTPDPHPERPGAPNDGAGLGTGQGVWPQGSTYLVHEGETLSTVSAATGVSVDKLAAHNQLVDVNLIYAGSALDIPR